MREPRINVYLCEHGCHTVTVDVDHGVTPFMIPCQREATPDRPLIPELTGKDGKCAGIAKSSMYPRGPKPEWIGEPTHEWYKPGPTEVAQLAPGDRHHVSKGGLLLRPRTNRTPVNHKP